MNRSILLNTNIWIYFYAKNPPDKYIQSEKLIDNYFGLLVVSTQILGELFHVLTRKNLVSYVEAKEVIIELTSNFAIINIDTIKVLKAIEINSRYGYAYWDSLIIATALTQNCSIIYSEDMQNNQLIDNQTRILNPFCSNLKL